MPRAISQMLVLSLILAAGLLSLGSLSPAQTSDAGQAAQDAKSATGQYICPPCGCDADGQKFAEPGRCPDCNMELVAQDKAWNVAIMVWDGVELLDFAGPGEVFSSSRGPDGESFNVFTVSKTKDAITSQGFVTVQPQYGIADCPHVDILVLPGGGGRAVANDPEMMEWIKATAHESEIALSVCTGAFLLGKAGMLDDLDVTTWHGAIDSLRREFPAARVHDDRRFVDSGQVVTSAGVSAGIDSSLHVVTRLLGLEAARNTARYMEYDWRPDRFGDAEAPAKDTPQADRAGN